MKVYIDLNIFDRLEKIDRLDEVEKQYYQELSDILLDRRLTTAYSNAHLNDLFRGYQKNPNFIDGHLNNIKLYTNNLSVCQYWGQNYVTWQYREIEDFFREKLTDWELEPTSYDEIFEDEPLLKAAIDIYKLIPLPAEFKKGYSVDQLWGIMFPLSKTDNTQYSLQADIFNFQSRLKSDYGLYKSFRNKLLNGLNRVKNNKEIIKSFQSNFRDLPKHLELTDIFDAYTPDTKTSENPMYSKVLDVFVKYDFAGYKGDGHFNNMFDDALHTFYASHFDFFLTNDERCKYKAEKTYEKLNIKTKVLKIEEIEIITNRL